MLNLCTFLCRPLQNHNLKWPSSAYFGDYSSFFFVFCFLFFVFSLGVTYLTRVSCERDRCSKQIYTAAKFEGNIYIKRYFFGGRRPWLGRRCRQFPFRKRSLPFETVDAISQETVMKNGIDRFKWQRPFCQNGIDRFKWQRPFWEMASTVSNGNDRIRKGNLRRRRHDYHTIVMCRVQALFLEARSLTVISTLMCTFRAAHEFSLT